MTRLVQPYDVHYVSTSRRALVPDIRWFPVDKLATRLARAQLVAVPGAPRRRGDDGRAGRRPPARGCRVDRLRRRDRQPHLGPAQRRGDHPAEPLGAVRQHPDPGHRSVSRVVLSVDGVPVNIDGLDELGRHARRGRVHHAADRPSLARPVVRRGDDVGRVRPEHPRRRRSPASRRCPAAYPQVPGTFHRLALSADGSRARGRRPRWRRHLSLAWHQPLRGAARRHRRRQPLLRPARVTSGWVASGSKGAKAPRLWVVDLSANPADPSAAATAVAGARGSTGGASSRRGWPPTATGSPCSRPSSTAPTPGSTSPVSCARATVCRNGLPSPCASVRR